MVRYVVFIRSVKNGKIKIIKRFAENLEMMKETKKNWTNHLRFVIRPESSVIMTSPIINEKYKNPFL